MQEDAAPYSIASRTSFNGTSPISLGEISTLNTAVSQLWIAEFGGCLRRESRASTVPGGRAIAAEYEVFKAALPSVCEAQRLDVDELALADFARIVTEYIAAALVDHGTEFTSNANLS